MIESIEFFTLDAPKGLPTLYRALDAPKEVSPCDIHNWEKAMSFHGRICGKCGRVQIVSSEDLLTKEKETA